MSEKMSEEDAVALAALVGEAYWYVRDRQVPIDIPSGIRFRPVATTTYPRGMPGFTMDIDIICGCCGRIETHDFGWFMERDPTDQERRLIGAGLTAGLDAGIREDYDALIKAAVLDAVSDTTPQAES